MVEEEGESLAWLRKREREIRKVYNRVIRFIYSFLLYNSKNCTIKYLTFDTLYEARFLVFDLSNAKSLAFDT